MADGGGWKEERPAYAPRTHYMRACRAIFISAERSSRSSSSFVQPAYTFFRNDVGLCPAASRRSSDLRKKLEIT